MPFFTFGYGQAYEGGYVERESRDHMVATFGQKWCWQYDSPEQAGVEEHNLRRVLFCVDCGKPEKPWNPEKMEPESLIEMLEFCCKCKVEL